MEEEKFYCERCDKEYTTVYADGYYIGDRLMEDVMFLVTMDQGKPVCIGVADECKPYMEQFNLKHWKKRCNEWCENMEEYVCPECGGDIFYG